jgi:Golgi phosphoprotein 3 (GPP34)
MVREFEYVGYAVRAADLIELAVAEPLILTGRWVKWVTIVDATPTGEPLLDASLAALAASPKRLMPTDWMARHPGYSPVDAGLAELARQGAVRVNSRRGTGRRTYTGVELLDAGRQARVCARLDRYIAAGSAADVLDWPLAGLVHQCTLRAAPRPPAARWASAARRLW